MHRGRDPAEYLRFELLLGTRPQPRNWLPTAPDATTLMVRETFWHKPRSRPRCSASRNQYDASGWWRIAADEAIVLDVVPPPCRYWGFALCDYRGGSFDYRYWQVHTNQRLADLGGC